MNPKRIVTVALLLFVGLCLGAIVVKEMRAEPASAAAPSAGTSPRAPMPARAEGAVHYVVFYFHGNMRCKTCKDIENQSRDAITSTFAGQIGSGALEWRSVNFDTPENKHFRDDFDLAYQSVIVAEERDGRIVRWENLADVWTKIHESPKEFEDYVVDRTASFLAGGSS
jgi:hypothetical protein